MASGRGSIDAFFTVDDAADLLRLGRAVDIVFEPAPEPDAVWLPFEALHGTDRVFKVSDDRLAGVDVRRLGEALGPNGGSGVLVTSRDLASGDQVVVSRLAYAVEGARVNPVPSEGH